VEINERTDQKYQSAYTMFHFLALGFFQSHAASALLVPIEPLAEKKIIYIFRINKG